MAVATRASPNRRRRVRHVDPCRGFQQRFPWIYRNRALIEPPRVQLDTRAPSEDASGVLLTGERSSAACTCATGETSEGEPVRRRERGSQRVVTLTLSLCLSLSLSAPHSVRVASSLFSRLFLFFGHPPPLAPPLSPECGCSRSRIHRERERERGTRECKRAPDRDRDRAIEIERGNERA